jgi:hypothetical protein
VTIGEGGSRNARSGDTRNPISAYAVDRDDDDDDAHTTSGRGTMKDEGGSGGGTGTIKPSLGKRLSVGVSNLMGFRAAQRDLVGSDGAPQNGDNCEHVLESSNSTMVMG